MLSYVKIIKQVDKFIKKANVKDGYAAGEYVRSIVNFKHRGVDNIKCAPNTLELFFEFKGDMDDFIEDQKELLEHYNHDKYRLNCDCGIRLITVKFDEDQIINFDIDNLIFNGTDLLVNGGNPEELEELQKKILNKEAEMTVEYANKIKENGNVDVLMILLKEGYTIELPNGFKFAGSSMHVDAVKELLNKHYFNVSNKNELIVKKLQEVIELLSV